VRILSPEHARTYQQRTDSSERWWFVHCGCMPRVAKSIRCNNELRAGIFLGLPYRHLTMTLRGILRRSWRLATGDAILPLLFLFVRKAVPCWRTALCWHWASGGSQAVSLTRALHRYAPRRRWHCLAQKRTLDGALGERARKHRRRLRTQRLPAHPPARRSRDALRCWARRGALRFAPLRHCRRGVTYGGSGAQRRAVCRLRILRGLCCAF